MPLDSPMPIGVIPKCDWNEKVLVSREAQLVSAIDRYRAGSWPVNNEWIEELATLRQPHEAAQLPNIQRLLDAHTRFQIGVNRAFHQGQRNEAEFNRARLIWFADLTELGVAHLFDWD